MAEVGTKASDNSKDPVLARFLLDSAIRELRVADGRGPHALADATGISLSTMKRWFTGKNAEWRRLQLEALMRAFGYPYEHPKTQQLVQLAADARRHNVVQRPEWLRSEAFDLSLSLERVSDAIWTYEMTVMPGLCQTAEYARAQIGQSVTDQAELEERVRLRVGRQVILRRTEPVPAALRVVIDEAVLHRRPAGNTKAMRGQLQHLVQIGALDNVTIQVIPFAAGAYDTDGNGPFRIMDSSLVGRRITAVETSVSATYHETSNATQRYEVNWRRLAGLALGAEESAAMISATLGRT